MPRPANEDRRPQILEATCRMIAREGVHRFTMGQVAEQAGVSRALIAYYFQTRDELLHDALAFAERRAIAEIERRSGTGSAIQRLTDALTLEFDESPAVRENWLLWESLTEAALFDAELRKPIELWSRAWNDAVAGMILDGQRDGSIPHDVDPDAAAERLTGLVDGFGPRWLLGELGASRAQDLIRAGVTRELSQDLTRPEAGSIIP